MDEVFRVIRNSEKMPGWDRIFVHGEKEWEAEIDNRANGIPLDGPTYEALEQLSSELNVPLNIKK